MTPATPVTGTMDKMAAVSAAIDLAPDGPEKDAALMHLAAARAALDARLDGECNRELDSATWALA